jgi:hypothetical protein
MGRQFLMETVVFVAVVAVITFGVGMLVRSAGVAVAAAVSPTPTAAADGVVNPSIVAVDAAERGGWTVQLDTGANLYLEPRAFQTGGAAPVPGQVLTFADQRCLLRVCTGYAVITDRDGTVYHGYRT